MNNLRYTWEKYVHNKIPLWIAMHLPKRVRLWTFIHVYGLQGQAPGPEYVEVYKYAVNEWNLK